MKLALKITPQRNTQYASMTATLAIPELLASPLHTFISDVVPVTLANQNYLLATLTDDALTSSLLLSTLGRMGAISEVYEYFERIESVTGPLLRPLDLPFSSFVPLEMAETRRYRGKTNEVFTRILLNVALYAGKYSIQDTDRLRILDPLAGGGTTLFLALAYGCDAFGVEIDKQDVETTSVFVKQYLANEGVPYKERDERSRKAGRRYQFEIGRKRETRTLVIAHGDTCETDLHMREVPGGPHMHAIVTDLPYGIQHFGEISDLLNGALPVWERMLLPGGTLALAWNATRIERAAMIELVQQCTKLRVCDEPPYTEFTHPVDRVIKRRDILVAVAE